MILEDEIWRLQEENEKKEETIIELRVGAERTKILERELNTRQEEVLHLKKDLVVLEQKLQQLSGIKQSFRACWISYSHRYSHDVHMTLMFGLRTRRITCHLSAFLDPVSCPNCDSVFSSLELEQRETLRLTKENKALVNGIFQLKTEVCFQQKTLSCLTQTSDIVSSFCNLLVYLTNQVMGFTIST